MELGRNYNGRSNQVTRAFSESNLSGGGSLSGVDMTRFTSACSNETAFPSMGTMPRRRIVRQQYPGWQDVNYERALCDAFWAGIDKAELIACLRPLLALHARETLAPSLQDFGTVSTRLFGTVFTRLLHRRYKTLTPSLQDVGIVTTRA